MLSSYDILAGEFDEVGHVFVDALDEPKEASFAVIIKNVAGIRHENLAKTGDHQIHHGGDFTEAVGFGVDQDIFELFDLLIDLIELRVDIIEAVFRFDIGEIIHQTAHFVAGHANKPQWLHCPIGKLRAQLFLSGDQGLASRLEIPNALGQQKGIVDHVDIVLRHDLLVTMFRNIHLEVLPIRNPVDAYNDNDFPWSPLTQLMREDVV